jgi:hypothetical protein
MRMTLVLLAVCVLVGCGEKKPQAVHRPDWVIRSQVVFESAELQAEPFRLWFPYIAGDLYGAANTGDFINPKVGPDHHFEIDLNRSHADLLASLQETKLSLSFLRLEPAEARIARLSPLVMQADGIDQIGAADWVDAGSRQRLMLVYFDRPARITGSSAAVRYDIQAAEAGYVWIAEDGTELKSVPRPERVILAVRKAQ